MGRTGTGNGADPGSPDARPGGGWLATHPATTALAAAVVGSVAAGAVAVSHQNPWWWGPAVAPMPAAAVGWAFATSFRRDLDAPTRRLYRLTAALGVAAFVAVVLLVD